MAKRLRLEDGGRDGGEAERSLQRRRDQADDGAFKEREPLDIEGLEEGLRINKNALDDGLLQQPDLFYRVSKELTLATSRRDAAKQGVADAEAHVELALHRSSEKYTVGEIKAHVAVAPSVRSARKLLADLQYEVNQLAALKEAFAQRSYALKELVALYIANYYSEIDTSAGNRAADAKYRDNRRKMHEARKRNS